jgi:hypothetical protein
LDAHCTLPSLPVSRRLTARVYQSSGHTSDLSRSLGAETMETRDTRRTSGLRRGPRAASGKSMWQETSLVPGLPFCSAAGASVPAHFSIYSNSFVGLTFCDRGPPKPRHLVPKSAISTTLHISEPFRVGATHLFWGSRPASVGTEDCVLPNSEPIPKKCNLAVSPTSACLA